MGNCCGRGSAEWISLDEIEPRQQPSMKEQSRDCTRSPLQERVKITITKRELEELFASARVQDVPVDRLFYQFIDAVHRGSDVQRCRSWEPTLNSIAE